MEFRRNVSYLLLILIAATALLFLIRNPDTIAPFFNTILMIGAPLYLGVWIARKYKSDWGLFGLGAMTFIASQILHIPFNTWVLQPFVNNLSLSPTPGSWGLALYGLIFGLSAGLFEETARYLVITLRIPKDRNWKSSLMLGAGHGGAEAMILGGITLYIFLQAVLFKDTSPEQLALFITPEEIGMTQAFVSSYWGLPWYASLLPFVERVSAITFHLSASILVMRAIRKRNFFWFIASLLWHTIFNMAAVFASLTWSIYITEGIIALGGLISLGIIFALREKEPIIEDIPDEPPSLPVEKPTLQKPISSEQLEDSRYD